MLLSVKYRPPLSCPQSELYIILIGYFHNNYNSKRSFTSKSFKQNHGKLGLVINMNEAKLSHIKAKEKIAVPQKMLGTHLTLISKSVVLYPGVFQCVFPLPLWI